MAKRTWVGPCARPPRFTLHPACNNQVAVDIFLEPARTVAVWVVFLYATVVLLVVSIVITTLTEAHCPPRLFIHDRDAGAGHDVVTLCVLVWNALMCASAGVLLLCRVAVDIFLEPARTAAVWAVFLYATAVLLVVAVVITALTEAYLRRSALWRPADGVG